MEINPRALYNRIKLVDLSPRTGGQPMYNYYEDVIKKPSQKLKGNVRVVFCCLPHHIQGMSKLVMLSWVKVQTFQNPEL